MPSFMRAATLFWPGLGPGAFFTLPLTVSCGVGIAAAGIDTTSDSGLTSAAGGGDSFSASSATDVDEDSSFGIVGGTDEGSCGKCRSFDVDSLRMMTLVGAGFALVALAPFAFALVADMVMMIDVVVSKVGGCLMGEL